MRLTLEDRPQRDLVLAIDLAAFAGQRQTIICRANGVLLGTAEISGPEDFNVRFSIPQNAIISDGRLWLTFEYPQAVFNKDTKDVRAVAFKSLVIREGDL